MDDKLKRDVEAVVAEIFSQKEEADQRTRTEEALQKSADTITELTEALEGRNTDLQTKADALVELEEKLADLNSELEAAKKEVTEANEKLTEAETTIENMKKDKAAELRMSELTEAGVARSDKEAQTAKVREMDDEEFASYRDELVDLRKAVEAELAKVAEEAEEEKAEETPAEETPAESAAEEEEEIEEAASEEDEESSEEASEEEDEETPPANVDPTKAVAAAMNLEVRPSDDMMAKYLKMGKAMASRMTKRNTEDD